MTRECSKCSIRHRGLCASLAAADLAALSRLGRRRRVAKHESIVWAGDENMLCANIVSGVFKLDASTADGREQIVGLLYPADFIGRPYAPSSHYNVVALTDAELCVFPRAGFERVLHNHTGLKRMLLQRTLDELDHTREWMLLLGRKTAEEKIASFLVQMARRLSHGRVEAASDSFVLPLSRTEMADLLGLTIETVSRQITKLRSAGIIDLRTTRSVRILDARALAARAEQG